MGMVVIDNFVPRLAVKIRQPKTLGPSPRRLSKSANGDRPIDVASLLGPVPRRTVASLSQNDVGSKDKNLNWRIWPTRNYGKANYKPSQIQMWLKKHPQLVGLLLGFANNTQDLYTVRMIRKNHWYVLLLIYVTVQSEVIPKITWAHSLWKWRCNPHRWIGLVVRALTPCV